MEEYRAMKETILRAVQENVKGTKEEVEKIVAAVRAGERVQIAYADPEDLDFMDPYTVRACW